MKKVVGIYTDVIRGIREIRNLNLKKKVLFDVNKKQMNQLLLK